LSRLVHKGLKSSGPGSALLAPQRLQTDNRPRAKSVGLSSNNAFRPTGSRTRQPARQAVRHSPQSMHFQALKRKLNSAP
jgi:hypothetical protein